MTVSRDIGDMERIGNHVASGVAAFSDVAGAATDPTAVTLTIRKPDRTVLVYGWPVAGANGSLVKEGGQTGRFYADVVLDQVGNWLFRLAGTGTVTAAAESYLTVARSWTT